MLRSARIIVICLAAVTLAACSSSPAATVAARTAPPPSCEQQYKAWQAGPARPFGKTLATALDAVQSASATEDIPATLAALKSAGPAAVQSERYPMPACADPHGYWGAILARIKAAADNAGSGSGLGGLILAEAPLKDVPGMETKLAAELKQNHVG